MGVPRCGIGQMGTLYSVNDSLSTALFQKIEAIFHSFTGLLQLTTSKSSHLQLRYGALKVLGSQDVLFVHHYSFEGLDNADWMQGS